MSTNQEAEKNEINEITEESVNVAKSNDESKLLLKGATTEDSSDKHDRC